MLIPSYLIWFLGYGIIIMGNRMGYVVEIIGAILSYLVLVQLTRLLKNKKMKSILILVLTLFYLIDIVTNSFFLIEIYL